jgi:hypothetical protein
MRISVGVLGEDRISRTFLRTGRNGLDLSNGFDRALDLVEDRISAQFRSQGAQSGGWEPLAESTVRQKGHARILEDTGALERAATSGATRRVSADEASFSVGPGADYWIYHHSKGPRSHLPRRPLLEVDEPLRRAIMRELQRELFGSPVVA